MRSLNRKNITIGDILLNMVTEKDITVVDIKRRLI